MTSVNDLFEPLNINALSGADDDDDDDDAFILMLSELLFVKIMSFEPKVIFVLVVPTLLPVISPPTVKEPFKLISPLTSTVPVNAGLAFVA